MTLSFLEMSQQDGLRDLLGASKRGPLRIREHPETGPFVESLTQLEIKTPARLIQVSGMRIGAKWCDLSFLIAVSRGLLLPSLPWDTKFCG